MAAYLDAKEADGAASIQRRRDGWKRAERHFGPLTPGQITPATCRAYRDRRKVSDGTIRTELATIRAGCRWHDKNTPATFWLPPAPPPRDRSLTRDEFRKLRAHADTHHVRVFIELMIQTAARPSDILRLQWSQVDFTRGRIVLGRSVGNKRRATVPMTDTARAVLEDAREASTTDFVVEWAGGPVGSIKRAFRNLAERAGLEGVTPYVLRHTAAVWMAEAGVPMSEISQYLGHTSTSVTERVYARYSPDYLRGAASALDV